VYVSRTPRILPFQIASTALVLLALGTAKDAWSQLANVPFDSNGNGTLDIVLVDGDYDGDGHVEPEDIQAAIHDLNGRLPGEEGRAVVLEGDYVEVCRGPGDPGGYCAGDPYLACDPANGSADCVAAGLSGSDAVCASITCQGWDTRTYAGTDLPRPGGGGLIDLDADDAGIVLACGPGVTIRGIPGKRRFDGASPSPTASGLGGISARLLSVRSTRDVAIGGCGLEAGTPRGVGAFDPVARDWPLVADGGSLSTLVDVAGGWRDREWNRWWVLLRPSCVAAGAPHAWCSGPEEFVQVVDTQDAGDTLLVAGFEQAPASGDRYAILYHSGGRCTLDPASVCEDDSGCTPSAGVCDRSIDDDVSRGSRNTVYISTSEDVVLQNLRVSGSSHSGVYAKNSRRVDLLDSELFENGGYYGHTLNRFPSVYWFSGHPDAPCLDGDSDCRMQDARIERTEIHHGGKGVNVRNDPEEGQMMGIERMRVRDNHIHDLFSADGSDFRGVQCGGKDAVCERNTIERVGTGLFVGSNSTVWPSQVPAEQGGRGSATNLTLRDNAILDLFTLRGGNPFGIIVLDFNEGVLMERNLVDQVGGSGDGIRIVGPNRDLRVDGIPIGAVGDASLSERNYSGVVAGIGEWATWMRLEVQAEDLGVDPASHTGVGAGFLAETAIERLELHTGSRISLVDEVDSGNRGGIGGGAEALYVEELVFHDGSGLLNLNGLHLYLGSLDGDPSQIIDESILCPNEIVDPGEECDDGNVESGDGCWSSCQVEEVLRIFGAPAGGSVGVRVDGIPIGVATSSGESLASVLDALVAAIGADATLAAAGVGVFREGNRIVTTGALTQLTLDDPGLFQDLPEVPTLDPRGIAALTALLAAAGVGFAVARR
jgi:cysteine-rich repeat protein